jgi:hypothetical protein
MEVSKKSKVLRRIVALESSVVKLRVAITLWIETLTGFPTRVNRPTCLQPASNVAATNVPRASSRLRHGPTRVSPHEGHDHPHARVRERENARTRECNEARERRRSPLRPERTLLPDSSGQDGISRVTLARIKGPCTSEWARGPDSRENAIVVHGRTTFASAVSLPSVISIQRRSASRWKRP